MYDTQQGASRTRDATVPRTAVLPAARQDTRQFEPSRSGANNRLAPGSTAPMKEASFSSAERAAQRPTAIPRFTTAAASQRSVSAAKNNPSAPGTTRSTTRPDSTSQEVPLLMESYQGSRRRQPPPSRRSPPRTMDPWDDTQSSLDIDSDAIFGIVMPRATTTARTAELPPRLIPELQALAAASSRQQPVSNKSTSSISSPSTRFSSSPSPWSVSTTTTTPTSWSSASPSLVQQVPLTGSTKRSQTVPMPAGKREKVPKMPALPESMRPSVQSEWPAGSTESTRSSSRKKTPLHTPAPTPPPRTSSAKHSVSRSSSKSDRQRATPVQQPTPSPSDADRSPLARRGRSDLNAVGDSLQYGTVARAHNDLQQSLHTLPSPTAPKVSETRRGKPPTAGSDSRFPSTPRRTPEAPSTRDERGVRKVNEVTREQERGRLVELPPKTTQDPGMKGQSSPGRAGTFSRLGLFGRRTKSPGTEVERSPRKLQRKGPAAGTGHEGYGRYGKRGRKTSQDNASGAGSESERSVSSSRRIPLFSSKSKDSRSSSRHNRSSQSDLDDFASTRLRPVPIIGGSGNSMRSNSGTQLDVYSTSAPPGPVFGRWESASQSQSSLGQRSVPDTPPIARHRVSSQESVPTLAIRRSQRFRNDADSFNLPTPIRTEGLSAPVFVNSQDDSRSSAFPASTPSTTTDPNRGDLVIQKPKEKKSRKLRWNIFKRRGTDTDPEVPVLTQSSSPEELAVAVSAIPVSRSMPYYAMMDSESEVNPPENVGEYLAQVVQSPAVSPLTGAYQQTEYIVDDEQPEAYEENAFLPSVPISPPQSFVRSPPPVSLQNQVDQQQIQVEQRPPRQPRLVRVGRIPPVVQRAEREHKPSRSSFSQPFARVPVSEEPYAESSSFDFDQNAPLQIHTDVLPSRPFAPLEIVQPVSAPTFGESEFLRFPTRQASEASTSSSSGGVLSILGPALVPGWSDSGSSGRSPINPNSYIMGSPTIDEVWNEYDDFIDHVMSPSRTRKSMKALGFTSNPELEQLPETQFTQSNQFFQPQVSDPLVSEFPVPPMKRPVVALAQATSATPPVVFPPPTMPERTVGEDIRLRRSRIVSALHSSMEMGSPVRDRISELGSLSGTYTKSTERLSISTTGRSLERSTTNTSLPETTPERSHQENVAMLEVVERSKDPVGQSEMHYASLMVAKWLSFGRVLFSPAHDEIQALPERHILVIDGLGNEDWSIYCAVSYEGQRAYVHDLKEKTNTKGAKTSRPSQHAPDNHRRAEVASFYERFPFPPAFFSVVVLRFPPAMAEAKMKNIVSECRRVLVPGGYLEMMLLDLDIVNMGVQTRRAVRELKFRMTTADKQISLRPIIDNAQSVLGSRGFTNISRCVVGVPVAGRPSGSTDSSSSSRSSGGSEGYKQGAGDARPGDASPRMTFGQGRRGPNISLNDLLSDRSDNADLRIGKIVSRTARTWWQHCFEASVINDGNLSRSIFADKNVLGECKARGSSFKMFIAYAQRPVFETRRRTMSEPVVSTLVTAGGQKQPQASSGNPRTA